MKTNGFTFVNVVHFLFKIVLIVVSILLIIQLANTVKENKWNDSIDNSDNDEFVVEVAFNLEVTVDEVTQQQFNERYL